MFMKNIKSSKIHAKILIQMSLQENISILGDSYVVKAFMSHLLVILLLLYFKCKEYNPI